MFPVRWPLPVVALTMMLMLLTACATRPGAPEAPVLSLDPAAQPGTQSYRPGHGASFINRVDVETTRRQQRQNAAPPPRSEAAVDRALTQMLAGHTLHVSGSGWTYTMYLAHNGRAELLRAGPTWQQYGMVESWYVNDLSELCLGTMWMVGLKTIDSRPPHTFRNSGWCLEIAEISDGRIALAWGDRIQYSGPLYQGDAFRFRANRFALRSYFRFWQANR